jgi:peptidoglycan glycosyltransferase
VAFAPADHPQIAVAVMLLNGGGAGPNATGGTVAGPVAKQVIEAALGSHG